MKTQNCPPRMTSPLSQTLFKHHYNPKGIRSFQEPNTPRSAILQQQFSSVTSPPFPVLQSQVRQHQSFPNFLTHRQPASASISIPPDRQSAQEENQIETNVSQREPSAFRMTSPPSVRTSILPSTSSNPNSVKRLQKNEAQIIGSI